MFFSPRLSVSEESNKAGDNKKKSKLDEDDVAALLGDEEDPQPVAKGAGPAKASAKAAKETPKLSAVGRTLAKRRRFVWNVQHVVFFIPRQSETLSM